MNAIAPRERLAAVLGMLGSEHDGECLAAARTAERLRQAFGVTWGDLLLPAEHIPPSPTSGWRELLGVCLQVPRHRLTPWEARFLGTVGSQRGISVKQRGILESIAAKGTNKKTRAG